MQYCPKCKINIRGHKTCCPLCQGQLQGEPEKNPFPVLAKPKVRSYLLPDLHIYSDSSGIVTSAGPVFCRSAGLEHTPWTVRRHRLG